MSLQRIYVASDTHMANLLQAMLRNEGIFAHVVPQGSAQVAMPSVWVDESDISRASPIVSRFDSRESRQRAARQSAWNCPTCGEEVQGDFSVCWNCQEPRDPAAVDPQRDLADHPAIQTDIDCVNCGYNLRGLAPEGRCPECGTKVLHSLFDRLREGIVADDESLQLGLYRIVRPVYHATGTPGTVLCMICHAWLRATEPVDKNSPVAQTPADAAWLTCHRLGEFAVEQFGTIGAAMEGLSRSGITSPADVATKLTALIQAGLLDSPGYDPKAAFTPLPALLRFLSQDR